MNNDNQVIAGATLQPVTTSLAEFRALPASNQITVIEDCPELPEAGESERKAA